MSATSTVPITQEAKVGQCISDLKVGDTFALSDIFYSLLLKSNNEAAEAIAITYGRDNFIKLMNGKALELGLSSMSFNDPSGLSPENVSNANDLFSFAKYLYNNQSGIIAVTKTKQYQIPNHSWINISKFINDKDYIGGKNGYTDEAKQTLVAMFREKIGKDYHNIAFILLDGAANKTDISKLSSFVKKYVAVKTDQPQSLAFNSK
jgi:D-alanyl-D-alanine carboxypeptidase